MANFLLLYSGGGMGANEAEQAQIMQAWGAWFTKLGNNVVDGGNPFTAVEKSISSDGDVKDGPVGTLAAGTLLSRLIRSMRQSRLPGTARFCGEAARLQYTKPSQ